MFTRNLVLLGSVALAGCSMNGMHPAAADSDPAAEANRNAVAEPTVGELAAYAGHAKFPADAAAKTDLQVASILSPDKSTIKIYNFSTDPLRNIDIWVNASYVQHVDGISPQGSVLIHTNELYNGLGKNFAGQSEPVAKVQISSDHGLFTTWGPASD
jgi:hypothetical protein